VHLGGMRLARDVRSRVVPMSSLDRVGPFAGLCVSVPIDSVRIGGVE
jgi:hypothetical protein